MSTLIRLAVILILMLLLAEHAKSKEEVDLRYMTKFSCSVDSPEEKPLGKGAKEAISKRVKEFLEAFKKNNPKVETYHAQAVNRQWDGKVHYCVLYKGLNSHKEDKHYYQEGRSRFSKEEWEKMLKSPPKW